MPHCKDIVKLYEEFKTRPRDTAEAVSPINNLLLKQIGGKVKEWGIKKGLEKTLGSSLGKSIGAKIFSAPVSIIAGILEPNDSMKSGVDYFYGTLKSIIIDLDPDYPDYSGALKKVPKLKDAIQTIQIEERGGVDGTANCFQCLNNIAADIEKLCSSKGQSFKAG